jgi:hypothetical protein
MLSVIDAIAQQTERSLPGGEVAGFKSRSRLWGDCRPERLVTDAPHIVTTTGPD